MSTAHCDRVRQFMQRANQATPNQPCLPNSEVRLLRAKLILEECLETIHALGFDLNILVPKDGLMLRQTGRPVNLVEIADGCADVSVVAIGTLIACGIDDEPILELVDETNLEKFGEGSYAREDGKWIKPRDWKPPKIATELVQQGLDTKIYSIVAEESYREQGTTKSVGPTD